MKIIDLARGLVVVPIAFALAACPDDAPDEDDSDACAGTSNVSAVGVCTGSAEPCGSFSALTCPQDGCTIDIGSYDDPYDDRCEGYPKDCSEITTEFLCGYQVGCKWTASGDGGDPDACDDAGSGGGEPSGGGAPSSPAPSSPPSSPAKP